jgi:predicted DNA-binding helix-hairpin-helix protein
MIRNIEPFQVPSNTSQHDKWYFLNLDAQWDKTTVPIFEAAARGKCVPLLKTLLTSHCTNSCNYCQFRAGRGFERQTWNEEKLAGVTMHLWKERKIIGLFLSSSVLKDPDIVTERQLCVLRKLRTMGYTGYIHLRLMPGVSKHYVREAVELSDRVGVNLEAPSAETFQDLCPDKGGYKEAVLKRLGWVVEEVQRVRSSYFDTKFGYSRSGVDTQMIVGAVGENDWVHLRTTMWLYESLGLKRVFYSGFKPVNNTPFENKPSCPSYREHRLYQCSFLFRDYKFNIKDFTDVVDDEGFLPNEDPKALFVKNNTDFFPIDLNEAKYYDILKIPRIGPVTAKRIIILRKNKKIRYLSDLEKTVGRKLGRAIAPYVDLLDGKPLIRFLK